MNKIKSFLTASVIVSTLILPGFAQALSFSADAIQIREGQFSHARMYWSDGRVRFEYIEDSVPMVQIYDTINNRVIWLDTEEKQFMIQKLPAEQQLDPMLRKNKIVSNPCASIEFAVCTRLKEVSINNRDAIKWLVTMTQDGLDSHTFLWIDKLYEIVVRQESPDNSLITVLIDDDQEFEGRKVRKLTVHAYSNDYRNQTTQWYDDELDIIVRQQYENGSMDELRNIKLEEVKEEKFTVPENYSEFGDKSRALKLNQGEKGPANN